MIHNVPSKKDLDTSKAFKLSGNQEFQAKNYVTSLELYTKSAIFAPSDSDELPIAIGNRSASLYQLNKWEVNNRYTYYFYVMQIFFLVVYFVLIKRGEFFFIRSYANVSICCIIKICIAENIYYTFFIECKIIIFMNVLIYIFCIA